jgi:hypothetical protein
MGEEAWWVGARSMLGRADTFRGGSSRVGQSRLQFEVGCHEVITSRWGRVCLRSVLKHHRQIPETG